MLDVFLILIAIPAAVWALGRTGRSAVAVIQANRLRGRELAERVEAGRLDSKKRAILRQADADAAGALREDYALTGAFVAAAGAAAIFGGRWAAYGQWAVGLYVAGLIAIVAGIGLALFGAVLRLLARPILDVEAGDRAAS